jgi:transcription antitermination protein NusB
MLGRRQYRIKVFQALYSWFQGGEPKLDLAEKNLFQSIDKIRELYFIQLSFLLEVVEFYRRRSEDARHKFYPTEEELNPNPKFLQNRVINMLITNKDLARQATYYKISWTEEQEMVRKIFQKIRTSKILQEYLDSGVDSFEEDLEVVWKIFRKYIEKSQELRFYCEERSIFWYDDFDTAAGFVLKTIKLIPPTFTENDDLTLLFGKTDPEEIAEDRKYIRELFHKTINHSEEFEKLIETRTRNWELDRIAITDIIVLKMALAEFIHFPSIPVKVTMNEYIEVSKHFSTPKSKLFVNGILDKLVEDLNHDKKIKKTGRGLMT